MSQAPSNEVTERAVLNARAREIIQQLDALYNSKRPGGGVHGQVIGMEPWTIRTTGDGLQCMYEAQYLLHELLDPFDRLPATPTVPAIPRTSAEAAPTLDAALADTDQVPYMIVFDDADRQPEVVIGGTRARYHYKQVSSSWNAHLFVKISSNSRDEPYPIVATPAPADSAAERDAAWISVEDRLPEAGTQVLVTRFAGRVANPTHPGYPGNPWVEVSSIEPKSKVFLCDFLSTGNVTHWQPLTAPPAALHTNTGEKT